MWKNSGKMEKHAGQNGGKIKKTMMKCQEHVGKNAEKNC